MDIVKRNLLRLLRSGALNEYEPLEPMSRYKWNRLFRVATLLRVADLAETGAKHSRFSPDGIPSVAWDDFQQLLSQDPNRTESTGIEGESELCNPWLNKRLAAIREKEPHTIDASMATLRLLDMLVAATRAMYVHGIALRESLLVGRYLRTRGQLVDFVKLDKWLRRLHIWRMAELTGNLLITGFGFEKDEVPFVHTVGTGTQRMVEKALNGKLACLSAKEWHFRQEQSGLVTGNTRASIKTLRRCMRFFNQAHLETLSTLGHSFVASLSEIEE